MSFTLPKLPYAMDALAPHISAETLEYHYGKHHNAYVVNLNKLVEGTPQANMKLEELIKTSKGGLFNNAAQVWNHTFYWDCLSPEGGGQPSGKIAKAIEEKWGSFDKFKQEFTNAALTQFGSGWAWLVKNGANEIEIIQTANADTPMCHHKKALLTCDVWEHAYYVDYRNARPTYVEAFWKLVNWDFVEANFVD